MSYIISRHNKLVAETTKPYLSGLRVRYGYLKTAGDPTINQAPELINLEPGKISNAKKWADMLQKGLRIVAVAEEQGDSNEFLVQDA